MDTVADEPVQEGHAHGEKRREKDRDRKKGEKTVKSYFTSHKLLVLYVGSKAGQQDQQQQQQRQQRQQQQLWGVRFGWPTRYFRQSEG